MSIPEISGHAHLSKSDLNNLCFSPSLRYTKQIMGEIALQNVVGSREKIEIHAFGGLVIKKVPTALLSPRDQQDFPPEFLSRLHQDNFFYRLHFLPLGNGSADNPTDVLRVLAVGITDLSDFADWLGTQQLESDLTNRALIGFSAYGLGKTIAKHLPILEVFAEYPPLNPNQWMDRSIMAMTPGLSGTFGGVVLGNFVPEFLDQTSQLAEHQRRIFHLLRRRDTLLAGLTDAELECQIRLEAIFTACGIR